MSVVPAAIARDLSPTGTLRAAINLGNPVLAQGTPAAPTGVTVDMARELGLAGGSPGRARLLRCGAEVARGDDGGAG